jgi:hypothetical protein
MSKRLKASVIISVKGKNACVVGTFSMMTRTILRTFEKASALTSKSGREIQFSKHECFNLWVYSLLN